MIRLALLALVVVGVASCMQRPGTTGPEIQRTLILRLNPQLSSALHMSAEPMDLTRVVWEVRDMGQNHLVWRDSADLRSDEPDAAIRVDATLTVDEGDHEYRGMMLLYGADPLMPEWAGLFGPVEVNTRQTIWNVPVPMGRGPLENLSVRNVTLSGLQQGLAPGASGTLTGITDGEQGAVIFWGSRHPDVASVDQTGRVTGLSPGDATILGISGFVRDSVVVRVHATGS